MPEIKQITEITLSPDDVRQIIKDYYGIHGHELTDIQFNVSGVEDPHDWSASMPLTYVLTNVTCKASKSQS